MNDDNLFPFQKLDAYRVAFALTKRVVEAKIRDAELRDQATRAAKSILVNLGEGLPSDAPGTRRRHFNIADGSLHETVAAVDLARALAAIDEEHASEIQALAWRMRALIRGLRG
jgi:four helix bundle protein